MKIKNILKENYYFLDCYCRAFLVVGIYALFNLIRFDVTELPLSFRIIVVVGTICFISLPLIKLEKKK